MADCDDQFRERIVFFGNQKLGGVLHDPVSNQLKEVKGGVKLKELFGKRVVIKFG